MSSTSIDIPAGCPIPAHPSLNNTLGAAFIGFLFAAILFGITNVQFLTYYQSSLRDSKLLKWAIAFLWVLDVLHLALVSHFLYFYLVTNFTNLAIIDVPTRSLCLHVIVTTLSDLIVRLFYARRVWTVSKKNRFLALGTLMLALVAFVSGIGFGIKAFSFVSTLQFNEISVIYTSLGTAVLADVWVAGSLCFHLVKNRTGFRSTDTMVNALIAYIITTGLLTSICSIGCFVSFATMPHNYIFIGFYFILSKLYLNSLLTTLNARERLRDGLSNSGVAMGSCQMPRIITVGNSSVPKLATPFDTVQDAPDSVNTRNEFNLGDKENPRRLVVSVRTETDYHTDESDTKTIRCAGPVPV